MRGIDLQPVPLRRRLFLGCVATLVGAAAANAQGTASSGTGLPANAQNPQTHLSETVRAAIEKVVIVAGTDPTSREISGTYEDATRGVHGGIADGTRLGTPSTQVGGVTVSFPIPVLTLPGAIAGGIMGGAERQAQRFRDELTEDIARETGQPLTNDGLALDVFRSLQRVSGLESQLFAASATVPQDADATLYVSITGVEIFVDADKATLTTTAGITLKRRSDDNKLYERTVTYEDHATLQQWNRNDKKLWHDYANYARHYLGRELSAEAFDRVALKHALTPRKSDSVKLSRRNPWQGKTKSTTPVLAWDSIFEGGSSYGSALASLDEADIAYDVEIYDERRLVYSQAQVQTDSHRLMYELEGCKEYRWSVRPVYRIGDAVRFGDWMRSAPADENGIVGRGAANGPAYTQDFAALEIGC